MRSQVTGYTRPLFAGDTSTTADVEELTSAGAGTVIVEASVASRASLHEWVSTAKPGRVLLVTDLERVGGMTALCPRCSSCTTASCCFVACTPPP